MIATSRPCKSILHDRFSKVVHYVTRPLRVPWYHWTLHLIRTHNRRLPFAVSNALLLRYAPHSMNLIGHNSRRRLREESSCNAGAPSPREIPSARPVSWHGCASRNRGVNNTRRDAPVPACKCIRGEGPVRKGRTLHRGRFLLRDRGSPLSTIRCIDTKRTIVGMMSIVAPRLSQIR